MPPSRALVAKEGDPQSRAELLGKLLIAIGEKPQMLRYGTGQELTFVVMASVTDAEAKQLAKVTGKQPTVIKMGDADLVPLLLKTGLQAGEIGKELYDASGKGWTGEVALSPCN